MATKPTIFTKFFIILLSIFGGFALSIMAGVVVVLYFFIDKSEAILFCFLITPFLWAVFSLWLYLSLSKKEALKRFAIFFGSLFVLISFGLSYG